MAEILDSSKADLERFLDEARLVAGFTGAGISTESGVPDFRSPGSAWMRNKPIPFDVFVASAEARREAWRRKFAMDDLYRGARPNVGHRTLAALVQSGKMPAVITQNIDNLHQASGLRQDQVIELHGNGTYAACLDCGAREELAWIRSIFEAQGSPPTCPHCGGILKSATISFGQPVPVKALRRARDLALACDLFLVIGSSLVVYPAAALPLVAKRNGARLVILNREPTALDREADLVVSGEIGLMLESISLKSRAN
jgi:NAD-dependent deacetylase